MIPDKSSVFVSYSTNHEDVFLNRLFGGRRTGFYIDVGAAHPMFENDTKALYDRGWSGINIEPNQSFFDVLAAERPRDRNLNIAISDMAGELCFFEVTGTGLSTCDPDEAARARKKGFEVIERQVKTETLRDVLEAARPPAIDLLKIDVEGFEPNVIRSNDWRRFRPLVILAEATFPETPERRPDVVGPLLAQEGYRHVYFDGLNEYYLENDFVAPEGAFDTPLNVFDRYIPFVQDRLSQEREFFREETESLKRERADTLTQMSLLRTELNRHLYLAQDMSRARKELAAMQARLTALGDQIETIDAARAAAEAKAHMIWLQIEDVDAARAAAVARADAAEARADAAEAWAEAMRQSTSWRITRPLRAIARPRRTLNILSGRPAD